MSVTCEDCERILVDGTAEEWLALEEHGVNCAVCAEELRWWKQLSIAAAELRDYRESPALWTRIQRSLIEQKTSARERTGWWDSVFDWLQMPKIWQLTLAGAMVLALALTGGYLFMERSATQTTGKTGLLKDDTLASVERTERDYMKAIDKLASEAKPQMESNSSPLMASYQEKLVVLDSAIDELRLQAGQNPSNAHLRYQLLAMYQEKEATLRDILETKR
jgi:hypothetical protein